MHLFRKHLYSICSSSTDILCCGAFGFRLFRKQRKRLRVMHDAYSKQRTAEISLLSIRFQPSAVRVATPRKTPPYREFKAELVKRAAKPQTY